MSAGPPAWTPWQPLPGAPAFSDATLTELLDGGQAFRWHRQTDGAWLGQWAGHLAALRRSPAGLEWSAPAATAGATGPALQRYLVCDPAGAAAHAAVLDALPWRGDPHLAAACADFPGLRLLGQPFGETLLAFLCSATKQIVQIKQMLGLLAEHLGSPLPCNHPGYIPTPTSAAPPSAPCNHPGYIPPATVATARALPDWDRLAAVSEEALRACQLGFRARYIHATAAYLAARPGWLEETAQLPYAAARERLLLLPGVGEKIADCVLLFGAGRLEAFPVDTWMLKAMARHYGLSDWSPTQVAHFGRVHFGAGAGLAQQFLFAWERRHGGR